SPIDPHRVVHAIQETVPEDTALVSSTSFPGFMTAAFYEVRNPGIGYIQARGSDGINYCLPQALGVQVAEPERNVVAVTGDGGIGYHIADLETATREDLPLTVVVFNNQSLGSSKMSQMANWNVDVSTDFSPEMSYAQIAQGCGCHGEVIEEPGNLDNALDNAVKSDRPALLDVRIDPYVPPPLLV
ncbi:MAG: thiamine pyrophosphate-dependent enzyme, partial [Halobacteria archaeon]|nr:thiamine pyrophosphate-dependent enzyme [Halobacteria archaeon]